MPTMRRGLFIFAALAALLPAISQAKDWWNEDWAFRKEISFDLTAAGANIPASPANVPVLVRLSLANFAFFNDTKPDGGDLRFVAGDGTTALKYHIEKYDPTMQMAIVWVQVPRLSGGVATDKIFLYYGNKSAAPAADAAATYDANQALVYHFGAPAGSPQDATAYKIEPSAFQAEVNPASLIGAGAKFAGNTVITIPAKGALRHIPAQGFTLSTWARFDAPQSRALLASLEDTNGAIVLGLDGAKPFAETRTGSTPVTVTGAADLTAADWHHLALSVGAGKVTLWVDGNEAGSAATTVGEVGGSLTLGGSTAGASFTGELDEVEVSNVARPAEWLEAVARSQGMVAPLVAYGGDQSANDAGESKEGYFAATLRNVTLDGWVVIVILVIMFFVSVWIMIGKTFLLGRVAKGNAHFLEEFHKVRNDPAAVERRFAPKQPDKPGAAFEKNDEEHEEFGASTLYRLYHHGMREVLTRLDGKSAGAARAQVLSAAAIESIRATMDASMTRMTQRLQSQMVLLTISIAGGPFLGLLGTVVGVMITFAAIAATGDVNVNAIAPGTAAALVATVAGLGVAIPCLFGYNWLNTKVKEIVVDMRVFSDEFVAGLAERYS